MKRKKFLKNLSLGAIITPFYTSNILGCSKEKTIEEKIENASCEASPSETAGPFPIKSPSDSVRENIIGNRAGIPLSIQIIIQNSANDCMPIEGVYVDIWQCDAKGNYSEYAGQLDGDFTTDHFLRGRQTTNANGEVSFVSIYPGWYPGRSPHLHIEVKKGNSSLLITQIAFPENISKAVYASSNYKGDFDPSNATDSEFNDSLDNNMSDLVTGDNINGYSLTKTIKVKA